VAGASSSFSQEAIRRGNDRRRGREKGVFIGSENLFLESIVLLL
jgi:hypothetical protein